MSSTINKQKGVAIVETLIYVFIFSLLALSIVLSLFSMGRSYGRIRASVALENSAQTALERMTREINGAISVDTAQSTLGSSPGVLTLNTYDSGGATSTIQFFVTNQILRIKENGVDTGPLTSDKAKVTSLIFNNITTSSSTAVRVRLTIESGQDESYKSKTFNTTNVLRGSYTP